MRQDGQKKVTIATSIAPFGIEKQRLAVQTWTALGFSVVSLNIRNEIEKLQPIFQDIDFHEVKRDAKQQYGKPFVYVNDILDYLQTCDVEICGIVNSDIQLRAEKDFVSYISQQSKNSTVFASRIDIESVESASGELYGYGFDMFFFDRDLLQYFPKCDAFCLGIPWWDYWVPCMALKRKLNPKYLQDTVAYHVQHPINYSLKNWREVGIIFSEFYRPEVARDLKSLLDSEQIEELDRMLGPEITYSFILDFYQQAELLNYREDIDEENHLASVVDEIIFEDFNDFEDNPLETQSSLDQIVENHHPKPNATYLALIESAWSFYSDNQLTQMVQTLQQSLEHSPDQTLTQAISDWIERFTQFATEQGLEFDAYSFSCKPIWQEFIGSHLLARSGRC
ncbi:MAG: hypothetical protein ACFBSC_09855 [Microcoleaceae cyanobacterium]